MVTSFFNHKKKTLPGRNATITSSGIWGSCHLLHPARRGRPLPTACQSEIASHIEEACENMNWLIDMTAMIVAKRRSGGFQVSLPLPCRAFDSAEKSCARC